MYTVLIVEDEMLVRLGIKSSVRWEKYRMTVVADVPDGDSAWGIYVREKPDVVITDLRMPGMSGMELISRIRKTDKDTRIVILTCLEEFDLVRKALSYGVSDYLLKLTMTQENMEAVLQKVMGELEERNVARLHSDARKNESGAFREKILRNYIVYQMYSEREFEEYARQYALRLHNGSLRLCIMEIDHFDRMKQLYRDDDGEIIRVALMNVLDELLGEGGTGEAAQIRENRYVLVFNCRQENEKRQSDVFALLQGIEQNMKTYFGVSATFALSDIQTGFRSLKGLYEQAARALEQKYYAGSGKVLTLDRLETEQIFHAALSGFLAEIEEMELPFAKEQIGRAGEFSRNAGKGREEAERFFEIFVSRIAYAFHAARGTETAEAAAAAVSELRLAETLEESVGILRAFLRKELEAAAEKSAFSHEIQKALLFMGENYKRELTLDGVAKHVNLSPNYFSNVFKKETGKNLTEYLANLRIEAAKRLLRGTDLKSYQIAVEVGFAESTYFSRVFKKMTGMSPNEYRDGVPYKRKP